MNAVGSCSTKKREMATNVFGKPINNPSLTPLERATEALDNPSEDGKDASARTFVQNLKKQYGDGVSTLCLVYNATGNSITFVDSKDWYGHIGESPYPQRIQNGQWGAFLHVHPTAQAYGSMGAVVYRGKDRNGNSCDYMMAWMHPWGSISNSVCAQARDADYFRTKWDAIYKILESSGMQYSDYCNGTWSSILTGSDTSAFVEATFNLQDAAAQVESVVAAAPVDS